MALGNEGDSFHQDNRPSGLIRTYLGRSPLVSGDESSLLLNASSTVARPVFTEYQASAFGNVKLVVHDCPVWVRGGSCSVMRLMELSFHLFPPPPYFSSFRNGKCPGHPGRVFEHFGVNLWFFVFIRRGAAQSEHLKGRKPQWESGALTLHDCGLSLGRR